MPISEVTSADVIGILAPIWHDKPATTRKLRQRIRAVMEWAVPTLDTERFEGRAVSQWASPARFHPVRQLCPSVVDYWRTGHYSILPKWTT